MIAFDGHLSSNDGPAAETSIAKRPKHTANIKKILSLSILIPILRIGMLCFFPIIVNSTSVSR
jgi:hypothetical protein